MATKKKPESAVTAAKPRKDTEKAVAISDGIFMYLGPSIRGVVQSGSIYRGTREQICDALAPAIKKFPEIEKFVFADAEIATARKQIRATGNHLNQLYGNLAAKAKN